MQSSARASNLRAIVAGDDEIRKPILEMVTMLDSIQREDIRGFRRASLLDPNAPTFTTDLKATPFELEAEVYLLLSLKLTRNSREPLLLPRNALSVDEISTGGVSYGTAESTHFRNSTVMFREFHHEGPDSSDDKAGLVAKIFQYTYSVAHTAHDITDYYILLREYLPIDSGDSDMYRRFGFAGGFLCESNVAGLHVIPVSHIISHFALTKMEECIHVLPIDRVCVIQ